MNQSFKFLKTNMEFKTFKSFANHVRNYAIKNNLVLNECLYENYVTLNGETNCKHCGNKTKYISYTKGFQSTCNTPICYKHFVEKNKEYYFNFVSVKNYYDIYDDIKINVSFSKRYHSIVKDILTNNRIFDKKCLACGKKHIKRGISCSAKCRIQNILNTRLKNGNMTEVFGIEKKIDYKKFEFNGKTYKCKMNANDNELLTEFKNNLTEYIKFHLENNIGVIEYCKICENKILRNDVFGFKRNKRVFCSKNCYYEAKKSGLYPTTIQTRLKQSKNLKSKISNGQFTPQITNSWCKSKTPVNINGITRYVRSSWEAVFWQLNPLFLYETVRIPYVYRNESHSYLIDFYDELNNVLYEIKPKCEFENEKVIAKVEFAQKYARTIGATYVKIDEDYFKDKFDLIQNLNLDKNILTKFYKGICYESLEN